MTNQELVDIIRNELSNGIRLDKIRQALDKQGYQKEDIDKAVATIYGNKEFKANLGDMLSEKSKIMFLVSFVLTYALGLFLIKSSKLKYEFFYKPIMTFINFLDGKIEFSLLYFFAGLLFVALSITILYICVIKDKKFDYEILGALLVSSLITLIIMGFSLSKSAIITGFAVAIFYFVQRTIDSDHIFKKLNSSPAISYSVSTPIRIFNFSVAIAILVLLMNNQEAAKDDMTEFFATKLGLNVDDLGNMQTQMIEQQKVGAYAMADYIEQSLVYSLLESNQFSNQQKALCFANVNSSLEGIDKEIKMKIDEQLSNAAKSQNTIDVSSAMSLINVFDKFSFLIAPATVLMIMEFFGLLLKELISAWSFVLWRFIGKEEIIPVKKAD